MSEKYNLVGKKFGKLTVIEKAGKTKHRQTLWKCLCDCGGQNVVRTCHLVSGRIKSCGCLVSETTTARNTTHGKRYTKIYKIWQGMKDRCNQESHVGYKDYGGRGIKVCKEWNESFEAFYEWSIANGYKEGLTIDRIDSNGCYCPENCKWSTTYEQSRNKRNNVYITYNGETKIMTDWAKYLGMEPKTLSARIRKYGWSVERAFTTPVDEVRSKNRKGKKSSFKS